MMGKVIVCYCIESEGTVLAAGENDHFEEILLTKHNRVYRGDTYLFTTSQLYGVDKDVTVKMNNGGKYTYKVVATYSKALGAGDSPYSRTSTGYRLIPVGIKSLKNPSAGKMTVTYDKNAKGTGYVVQYWSKSDMSDAKVIAVKGGEYGVADVQRDAEGQDVQRAGEGVQARRG